MALVEMLMPKMGESIMEGTILTWLKKVGDTIEQDESVLEVATDKVDTEVPATHAGVLQEILANEGDVIEVGKPVAIIATDGDGNGVEVSVASEEKEPEVSVPETVASPVQATPIAATKIPTRSPSGKFYSPLVRNIAEEENITLTELEGILGSGKEGRVTKKDIVSYIKTRTSGAPAAPVLTPANGNGHARPQPTPQPLSVSGDDEIIEMDRMRKMIAERMVASKQISPHVTSFVEADVTGIVSWRNKWKGAFKETEGASLTFTPIFLDAVVRAIKDYPMINVSVDGDRIIRRKAINVGMAVALPTGNLIVPVIHNTDQYNLKGMAIKVNDLARRARENKLQPDELSGGTYTISNVGSFGNVMGTPIIMQPQVGILALGAIVKKPAVIDTDHGDAIAIRHKMFLSHSYDHRVVDGALGGMFVRRVADYLEGFDTKQSL